MVVRPDWVGHSGVTSAHFGPVACSALWLIAYHTNGSVLRLTDTINLGVTHVPSRVGVAEGVPQSLAVCPCQWSYSKSCHWSCREYISQDGIPPDRIGVPPRQDKGIRPPPPSTGQDRGSPTPEKSHGFPQEDFLVFMICM